MNLLGRGFMLVMTQTTLVVALPGLGILIEHIGMPKLGQIGPDYLFGLVGAICYGTRHCGILLCWFIGHCFIDITMNWTIHIPVKYRTQFI